MQLLVIVSMFFAFTLFIAVFQGFGRRIDNKNKRLQSIVGNSNQEIDEELNIPFTQRFLMPVLYSVLKTFSRLFPKNKQKDTIELEKKLKLAGIKLSSNEFLAARFIFAIVLVVISFTLAFLLDIFPFLKFLIILMALVLAVFVPSYYLKIKIKKRQQGIRDQLPDVLDLMTVSVEAGLSFDMAIFKISENFQGMLVDELMMVQREIQMALPRRDALKKFADKNDIPELKTFVGALIQADHLGLPIKNVLRIQSAQLRLARKQIAEEKAMKAPIKMMLPLIIFVFPVIFIILLGPTILQMMKTFG